MSKLERGVFKSQERWVSKWKRDVKEREMSEQEKGIRVRRERH